MKRNNVYNLIFYFINKDFYLKTWNTIKMNGNIRNNKLKLLIQ